MTGSMIDDSSDFINSSDIDSTSLNAGELINKWTTALNVEDDDAEINIDPPLNIDSAPSNTQELKPSSIIPTTAPVQERIEIMV